jgi:hypothetical protein
MASCRLCGETDPRRMTGLMVLWFGRLAGLPPDYGYFYLCPRCFAACIEPHLDEVLGVVAAYHPDSPRWDPDHPSHHAHAYGAPHLPHPHPQPPFESGTTSPAPGAPDPHPQPQPQEPATAREARRWLEPEPPAA